MKNISLGFREREFFSSFISATDLLSDLEQAKKFLQLCISISKMDTVYWPIFIKIFEVGKAWFGLAWFISGSVVGMGRNCRTHSVGSSGVDGIGSLLAFLLRVREKCFYDILNTCHNSPLRQINVLSWRNFAVPAPVHLPLHY